MAGFGRAGMAAPGAGPGIVAHPVEWRQLAAGITLGGNMESLEAVGFGGDVGLCRQILGLVAVVGRRALVTALVLFQGTRFGQSKKSLSLIIKK